MAVVPLSGCNRFKDDDETNVGPNSLMFRNSDSLPHSIRWTLRYLGQSDEGTASEETEREGEIEATATVSLEPGDSRIFNDLVNEEGVYAIDVAVRGSERRFRFEHPSEVNGVTTVYGVEVNEMGGLGLINVSVESLK